MQTLFLFRRKHDPAQRLAMKIVEVVKRFNNRNWYVSIEDKLAAVDLAGDMIVKQYNDALRRAFPARARR